MEKRTCFSTVCVPHDMVAVRDFEFTPKFGKALYLYRKKNEGIAGRLQCEVQER